MTATVPAIADAPGSAASHSTCPPTSTDPAISSSRHPRGTVTTAIATRMSTANATDSQVSSLIECLERRRERGAEQADGRDQLRAPRDRHGGRDGRDHARERQREPVGHEVEARRRGCERRVGARNAGGDRAERRPVRPVAALDEHARAEGESATRSRPWRPARPARSTRGSSRARRRSRSRAPSPRLPQSRSRAGRSDPSLARARRSSCAEAAGRRRLGRRRGRRDVDDFHRLGRDDHRLGRRSGRRSRCRRHDRRRLHGRSGLRRRRSRRRPGRVPDVAPDLRQLFRKPHQLTLEPVEASRNPYERGRSSSAMRVSILHPQAVSKGAHPGLSSGRAPRFRVRRGARGATPARRGRA